MLFRSVLASLAVLPAVLAQVGNIVQITENFGPNPNDVQFWIYVPANTPANAPILVNPHWCTGTAAAVFRGTQLAANADIYKYIMIFPETPRSSKCWDLSSPETLKHDAGGDSLGIASMVRWTIQKYGANPNRVFSMGTSSGAMMTNVLLGAYPELFAAGSAWAGVPFGCYSDVGGTANWSSACATGQIRHTGAEWKAIVEAAYPGYTGWRPKFQSVHGSSDEVVNQQNLEEQIKQWTAVLGQSTTPIQTILNTPNPNWTTYVFGDKYQAINATGVSHNIQTVTDTVLDFFDLKCTTPTGCFGRPSSGGPTSTVTRTSTAAVSTRTSTTLITTTIRTTTTSRLVVPTTTTTTTARPATTSAGGNGGVAPKWGQCGGMNWTGPTACAAGSKCTFSNAWYSQCL